MSSTRAGEARILENLNPQQREAVLHEQGPLLIIAGAGSGKTRVITRRIAYLISRGARADRVLALTFTNKAAGEMKERTQSLCVLECPWISTYHSFAARLLRQHIHRLQPYDRSFSIYDTDDCRTLVKEVLAELQVDRALWTPRAAHGEISHIKNRARDGVERFFGADFAHGQVLREIFQLYDRRMKERNALDFDDLLLLSLRLFREQDDVLQRYREQFAHVLVDEYQDTNSIQYEITRLLTGHERNVCVTGDPDQSIYRWRGADIENILNFERDYPDAKIVKLEQNYRSTKNVLQVANNLIRHNQLRKAKDLWTDKPQGEPVRVYRFDGERPEARETACLVQELIGEGTPASEIAIFYRLNSLSRAIEEELIHVNVPYTIVGGIEFFLRKEVKDVLAYLQVLDNPRDEENLKRIINLPTRGVGKKSVEKLVAAARSGESSLFDVVLAGAEGVGLTKRAQGGVGRLAELFRHLAEIRDDSVEALVRAVIDGADFEAYLRASYDGSEAIDRAENLGELLGSGLEYDRLHPEGGLRGFLENVRLLSSVDRWHGDPNRVTLMTLHSAKGLEFPVVIIAGVEQGILPLLRQDDPDPDIEEERRLMYVGVTRAMEKLYITHAANRMRFGQTRSSQPSDFLRELLPERDSAGDDDALELDQETQRSLEGDPYAAVEFDDFGGDESIGGEWDLDEDPYPLGARVYHDDYGEGNVIRSTGQGPRRRVTIAFDDAGEKQFVAGYAPLRRVR